VNPKIAAHGGRVSLLEIDAKGVVVLQFGGGCHGCGMVDVTLKHGVLVAEFALPDEAEPAPVFKA